MNSIKWYVNTYVHAGTSDKALLRDFWNRLNNNPDYMVPAMRDERKKVYRMALAQHHENQAIMRDVNL